MPRVIHVIQVDEEQLGPVPLPVFDSRLRGPFRAALVLHHIRHVALHQLGEAGPVMKYGDAAGRPLGTQSAENVWKAAGFVLAGGRDFLHPLQVTVGSDAVLLRPGRANHRHPVGAAERGHHATRFQAPRPARHQPAQRWPAGRDHAIDAEPVHADDDGVWLPFLKLPRGCRRATQHQNSDCDSSHLLPVTSSNMRADSVPLQSQEGCVSGLQRESHSSADWVFWTCRAVRSAGCAATFHRMFIRLKPSWVRLEAQPRQVRSGCIPCSGTRSAGEQCRDDRGRPRLPDRPHDPYLPQRPR